MQTEDYMVYYYTYIRLFCDFEDPRKTTLLGYKIKIYKIAIITI